MLYFSQLFVNTFINLSFAQLINDVYLNVHVTVASLILQKQNYSD